MGLLKGTMTYQRFFLTEISNLGPEEIAEKLNLFRFKAINPQGNDSESFGWVGFLSEYNAQNKIEIKDFLYDNRVVLSLRIDKLLLPRDFLKAKIKQCMSEFVRENKQEPSKAVKKEIEQAETQALRERILPKTKIVSAVWDLKTQEIRILSRSVTQVDCFISLFASSFLLRPVLADFSELVVGHAEKNSEIQLLESLNYRPLYNSAQIYESN